MANSIRRQVMLKRKCSQKTNDKTTKKQVEYIAKRSTTGSRGKGWEYKVKKAAAPVKVGESWIFTYRIEYQKSGGRGEAWKGQWAEILKYVIEVGNGTKYGKFPWRVTHPDEKEIKAILAEEGYLEELDHVFMPDNERPTVHDDKLLPMDEDHQKKYADISFDRKDHFTHIYDRDAQIERVISAIKAAQASLMENRFHCVLYGPPGCGKTEILLAVCTMLGREGEAYIKLDATSTTKAGIESHLLDPNTLIPPVIMIEEIEKTNEMDLRWMLGVLDKRGEIRKLNYRINARRNVPMLCLATVNNMELFKNVLAGALASRFPNKLYCPRPGREIMKRILEREVAKSKGKTEWIEPALQFAVDDLGINDPREVTPICLCGGDDLLKKTYQRWYIHTMEPGDQEKAKEKAPHWFKD